MGFAGVCGGTLSGYERIMMWNLKQKIDENSIFNLKIFWQIKNEEIFLKKNSFNSTK